MKALTAKELVEALCKWGMSHNRIGKEIGVRNTTISRIADGKVKAPHVRTEELLRTLYKKYVGE